MQPELQAVNRAFSKQSEGYDRYDQANRILQWMRVRVRKHVLQFLKSEDRILELNAGTGLDAVYFTEQGCKVLATDLSDGMVKQMREKLLNKHLDGKLDVRQCSYTELSNLGGEKFDYIFSNFGGLNCIPDLKAVIKDIPSLLKPNGYVTFVIMPPVCPWELGSLLKGNLKSAFRRFSSNGVQAHLEGEYFPTYYFSPARVIKDFGKGFKKIKLEGLASISPPPHAEKFPEKFPSAYKMLTSLDEKLCLLPPFRSWADHFILTVQYCPEKYNGGQKQ